jgi:hypothetical protein
MKKTIKLIAEQDLKKSIANISDNPEKMELLRDFLSKIYGEDSVNKIMELMGKVKTEPSKNITTNSKDSVTNKETPRRYGYILPPNALDLNNPKEFEVYSSISQNFINTMPSNLLGITGSMMATAAKNAFNKYGNYVPPELALAQLAQEGGFVSDPNARPIRTKNPFNVGNVDSGANVFKTSVMGGIQSYYNLIASRYLVPGKDMDDLLTNFVNVSGNRYASDKNYEERLKSIISRIQPISQKLYATVKKSDTDKTRA